LYCILLVYNFSTQGAAKLGGPISLGPENFVSPVQCIPSPTWAVEGL